MFFYPDHNGLFAHAIDLLRHPAVGRLTGPLGLACPMEEPRLCDAVLHTSMDAIGVGRLDGMG